MTEISLIVTLNNQFTLPYLTDHVLQVCTENDLEILNFAAHEQWIQMMSRDSDGKQLTLYQLQKGIWMSTKSNTKHDLIKKIADLVETF